jgi:integrase
MAKPFKTPNGKWRAQIRRKGQRSISKVFQKKGEASEWLDVMRGNPDEIEAFPDVEARKRTLTQVIDAYTLSRTGRDEGIIYRLSWWKEQRGAFPLSEFSKTKIKEAIRELAQENVKHRAGSGVVRTLSRSKAPATLNRYLQAVSSVLTWAVENGWITKNPALGIKRLKEPRGRVRWLSSSERKRLLEACNQSEWKDLGLLVRMAISTGARQGELLNLRWEDLDLRKGLAYLNNTKNNEPRILPLIVLVKNALRAMQPPINEGYVFHALRNTDRPFGGFRKHWDTAVLTAQLEDFRFHDLRHTAASYLAMSGASPLEIGDVLGHRTLAMVYRYSHLSTAHKATLMERVLGKMM